MALSDINNASRHIKQQKEIASEELTRLELMDWDEILVNLPEEDKQQLTDEIKGAVNKIRYALNRMDA